MSIVPESVSAPIVQANPELWRVGEVDWQDLAGPGVFAISGSSFIDAHCPYGALGNPFVVVVGDGVEQLSRVQRERIAQDTNTPETVFVNGVQKAALGNTAVNLSVLTPLGAEMGVCAHGFLGALQALIKTGRLALGTEASIVTTVATSAKAIIGRQGEIGLAFRPEPPRDLEVATETLTDIYGVDPGRYINCGVLSVGSPKLTLEVSLEVFNRIQQNLRNLSFDALLKLQTEARINGIHIFCRNPDTRMPEKCIQNNAFSGKDNLADRATGVSNAAQIAADPRVKVGTRLEVTQYSFDGPSARLAITKAAPDEILVGGSAAPFNFKQLYKD